MGFNLIRAVASAFGGNYGGVIKEVASGLGKKTKTAVEKIVGIDKIDSVMDILNVGADDLSRDPEFLKSMEKLEIEKLNSFRDFMLEYEGRAADQHVFIKILRGSFRPVASYLTLGALFYCVGVGISRQLPIDNLVPPILAYLALIQIGFWYGERSVSRVLDVYKNKRPFS